MSLFASKSTVSYKQLPTSTDKRPYMSKFNRRGLHSDLFHPSVEQCARPFIFVPAHPGCSKTRTQSITMNQSVLLLLLLLVVT